MNQTAVSKLKKAKTAHIRWRTYAEALVAGHEHVIDQIPVKHTDCEFGNWYYGDGQEFSTSKLFQEIGYIHQELHVEFEIIFNLVALGNEQVEVPGFFARLMGATVRLQKQSYDKANERLQNLKSISQRLISKIDELEQKLLEENIV